LTDVKRVLHDVLKTPWSAVAGDSTANDVANITAMASTNLSIKRRGEVCGPGGGVVWVEAGCPVCGAVFELVLVFISIA